MARHLVSVRPRAALVVALLATGGLSACGFDYATDQIYNSSTGTNHRTGPVDVLSALVVSSSDGQGTFIATFNNNSTTKADSVTSLAAGSSSPTVKVSGFSPLDLAPSSFINIADSEQIKVTGDFIAGQYVDLVMDLDQADTIEMSVPVVAASDEFEGLDTTAKESPSSASSATASVPPSEAPSEGSTESTSPAASETPTAATESGSPAQ